MEADQKLDFIRESMEKFCEALKLKIEELGTEVHTELGDIY